MRTSRILILSGAIALVPGAAAAHGVVLEKPSFPSILLKWDLDPFFIVLIGLVSWIYYLGVRKVNREHPAAPVPTMRVVYFYGGIAALVIAVLSPLAYYDTTLFSVHMWQHMVLTLGAAPLLALGAPITLALRAASPKVRRELLLPILHSKIVGVLAFPVFSWVVFVAMMWGSHFSPLYNEALENAWLHRLEHAGYVSAALLFWWPVIAADPIRWRMNHPLRILYLFLQMPQNSFLGVAFYGSNSVLYEHYETLLRTWGPTPIADQQLAGISMWVFGDLVFIAAVAAVAYSWVQHDDREGKRQDRMMARRKAEAAQEAALASRE